jgi:hypothetical protein
VQNTWVGHDQSSFWLRESPVPTRMGAAPRLLSRRAVTTIGVWAAAILVPGITERVAMGTRVSDYLFRVVHLAARWL